MKLPVRVLAMAVLSLFAAIPAGAAQVRLAETYTLPPSERVYSNLYVVADSLVVSGEIFGDVALAGLNVVFSGKGNTDALFFGGKVDSLGLVNGDVRAGGFKLNISGGVGGDAVLFGALVRVLPGVLVRGDIVAAGANVSVGGNVLGDVYVAGHNVFINGKVSGNVKIYSSGKIEFGDKADIAGSVTYFSQSLAEINETASIKGEVFHEFSSPIISAKDIGGFFSGLFGWFFLIRLLVTLASATVFVLVFRRLSAELVRLSVEEFWKTTAVGLVTALAIPFAGLFLIITILGSAIGFVLLTIGLTMAIVASIYSGVVFGYICSRYFFKEELPDIISWKRALIGALAAHVIFLAPYIGLFAWTLLFLNAFGAVSFLAYKHFFTSR